MPGGAPTSHDPSPEVVVRDMLTIGLGLHRQGNLEAAETIYRDVLARDPGNPNAQHFLGMISLQAGRFQEAVELISAAIAGNAGMAEMYINRGLARVGLHQFDGALADYDRAVAVRPELAQAHHRRGDALQALERPADALASFDRALALAPADAAAHQSRGDALYALGRFDDAFAAYEKAVAISGNNPLAWFNRGNALRQLRRIGEAIESYDRALALKPDFSVAHHNRAVCLMLQGRLAEGFAEYEWRKRCPDAESGRDYAQPAWTGAEDLAGKTLYVWPELFLGDLIQFCRYAKLAEARGARVVLSAPAALHGLLRTLSPTIGLAAPHDAPASFDYHCALMSLPLAFGPEAGAVPSEPAYLAAEPERAARWRERLGTRGFRIGVCWQGSTAAYSLPMQRSFPLRLLEGLARLPGVRLISLQKHDGLEQLQDLPPGMAVETLGGDFDAGPEAFIDTAAVIAHCDLVISADTATAHVAGALGAPTWVPLPFVPDWRWGLEGASTDWYPSLTLYRQAAKGDWAAPLAEMEIELRTWLTQRGAADA